MKKYHIFSVVLIFCILIITNSGFTQDSEFIEFQPVLTNGATDWEFFTIGDNHYLVVANYYNGSSYNTDSKIYQWNGSNFVEFQSIPTNGAFGWEFFTIGDNHYLVVANYYSGSSYNTDSKIYQWNGSSFVEFQSIPTNGAYNWDFFTIGDNYYLAVANAYDGSSRNIDSKIYQWNGSNFVESQSILTNGATDWEFFTIGDNHYLVVANFHNDSTYNIDSKIYQWNGSNFVEFQSIPTNGAFGWEFFTIGVNHYLVAANYHNGSSFNIDSKIYQWNDSNFVEFQSILTNGANDWEFFTIRDNHYLVVANVYDGFTFDINSKIYKWYGLTFLEFALIPTNRAEDWEFFIIDSEYYLAVANFYEGSTHNTNSIIYKWHDNSPSIVSITDVPDDQGCFARIIWDRSELDTVGSALPVTMYGVWRKLDEELKWNEITERKNIELRDGVIWESVGTVPAIQSEQYYFVAPTLHDSTEEGLAWSVFQITSHTTDPFTWYVSLPDSGYSVDNLAPTAPTGLIAMLEENVVVLNWNRSNEEDFNYFTIYRGTESGFSLDEPFAFTIDTTFTDTQLEEGVAYYYRVTTADFAGNESDPSNESDMVVQVESSDVLIEVPQIFSLSQNYPNPFNPTTTIQYALPEFSKVILTVYNVSGQAVEVLVNNNQSTGEYQIQWKPEGLASGIYFYSLIINDQIVETRKMFLLK